MDISHVLSSLQAQQDHALIGLVLGLALVLGIAALIALYRTSKESREREAARQRFDADLDQRTKALAEAEQRFEQERDASEQQLRLLMRELTHRSKNLLAVIQAIARQTARRTETTDAFLDSFGARLHAIGMSHDLLVADNWHGASLRMLAEQQLEQHLEGEGEGARIYIDGEDVVLKPEAVHNLGLALHELAVNAEKFGALSNGAGTIGVHWELDEEEEVLRLTWEEHGGPELGEPSRSGFGCAMLESVVGKALSGEVTLSFPVEGARCEIVIPTAHIASRG